MNGGKYQSELRRAETLYERGELDSAKNILIKIKNAEPNNAEVLRLLGFIAGRQRNFSEAALHLNSLMKLAPDFVEGWYYLGKSFLEIKNFDEAIECFGTAIRLYPQFFEALHDCGLAYLSLHRLDEAIRSFEAAYALNPDSVELWTNLGLAFGKQRKFEREIICYDNALRLKPRNLTALTYRAIALCENEQYVEAIEACKHILDSNTESVENVRSYLLLSKLMVADWADIDRHVSLMKEEIRTGKSRINPFIFLAISNSPEEQLFAAHKYATDLYPPSDKKLCLNERYQHERIRVAYLSADYHSHATSILMLELFKKHDHGRFKTVAISFGPDEESSLRNELVASFDRFVDVREMNDFQVATLLREMEIDIAVDLKGYTTSSRPGILAYRPTPIQVNYLGYPGTMAVDYIDYLIADRFVIPESEEKFYKESIVRLPDSYQVNGKNRSIDQMLPERKDYGLPDEAFVFCSFNNTYKNNPTMFNVWMNLLGQVSGSVLWLFTKGSHFEENIKAEAARRGVDPKRVVFARNEPIFKHMKRIGLADLFLDSLPYTAHTTASDALWAEVPVVTCVGSSFAGRVGQSVLHAIDMPELVTHSLDKYEQLAFTLATDVNALTVVRDKLRQKIKTAPLFDSERFTRHLEWAYEEMWRRHKQGEAPERITVPTLQ